MVKTGDIHLATAPSGASVYLDGKILNEKTPALLSSLLPGTYNIAIKAAGYKDCKMSLAVKAGSATVRDDVILIPEKWEEKALNVANFSNMIPVKGTSFFVMRKSDPHEPAVIYDYKNDETFFIREKGASAHKTENVFIKGIEPEGNSSNILLWSKERIGTMDLSEEIQDEAGKKAFALNWIFSSGKNIQKAFWAYNASHVIFLDENALYLLDVDASDFTGAKYLFDIKKDSGFFYSEEEGAVYYVGPKAESLVSTVVVGKKIEESKETK